MSAPIALPHRVTPGMCPVNGIRDLIQWRYGRDWSNEFVHGLGLGGGFAYLRINVADPPRQVYWGNAPPRQHEYLAQLLGANCTVTENRTFKTAWGRACQAVDAGTPPLIGPLDMFHLHFYQGIYHARHIPIHYLLLVGYDDSRAYVLDTSLEAVQEVPLHALQAAWDVNVPGQGKRNCLAVLDLPEHLAPTDSLVRQAITDQCRVMLRPPVSMLGVPAMEKVSREIAGWPRELGQEVAAACLLQVRTFLSSPPDAEGGNYTAGRDRYLTFMREAEAAAGLDLAGPISDMQQSMATIPALAHATRDGRLEEAGRLMGLIAAVEKRAVAALEQIVVGSEAH